MKVIGLYLKPRLGAEMAAVSAVEALASLGFQGDCQRDPASPRQVLVFSQSVLDALELPSTAVRANVVVDEPIDQFQSGTLLRLGASVQLRLTLACEPCHKLERHRAGLARQLRGRRGMLARVVSSGVAKVGAPVAVMERQCLPLKEAWHARVADIVRNLPEDMWLTYTQLALLAGIQTTYCRAFPRLLRKLRIESSLVQAERVVSSKEAETRRTEATYWDGVSYYQSQESGLRGA
jgi:MOSC domain-containing protein YiiM